jgi:hypothetical protein
VCGFAKGEDSSKEIWVVRPGPFAGLLQMKEEEGDTWVLISMIPRIFFAVIYV